jgi:hypothetical protein
LALLSPTTAMNIDNIRATVTGSAAFYNLKGVL